MKKAVLETGKSIPLVTINLLVGFFNHGEDNSKRLSFKQKVGDSDIEWSLSELLKKPLIDLLMMGDLKYIIEEQ